VALAELLAAIEAEAAAQVRELLDAGKADAAAIEEEASRARVAREAHLLATWSAEHWRTADAGVAEARHRTRAALLAARAAMLERVRAQTRALLPALVDARIGRALAGAALACANHPGVIRCAPVIAQDLGAPSALRVEADPAVATGVEIELATGTRIVASLDALFDREWPQLASAAVALVDAEVTP
jgi:hypothetical protein